MIEVHPDYLSSFFLPSPLFVSSEDRHFERAPFPSFISSFLLSLYHLLTLSFDRSVPVASGCTRHRQRASSGALAAFAAPGKDVTSLLMRLERKQLADAAAASRRAADVELSLRNLALNIQVRSSSSTRVPPSAKLFVVFLLLFLFLVGVY